MKIGSISVEQLKHIRCGCDKRRWFSIGDPGAAGEERDYLFCPWCGDRLELVGVITKSDIAWAINQFPVDDSDT